MFKDPFFLEFLLHPSILAWCRLPGMIAILSRRTATAGSPYACWCCCKSPFACRFRDFCRCLFQFPQCPWEGILCPGPSHASLVSFGGWWCMSLPPLHPSLGPDTVFFHTCIVPSTAIFMSSFLGLGHACSTLHLSFCKLGHVCSILHLSFPKLGHACSIYLPFPKPGHAWFICLSVS